MAQDSGQKTEKPTPKKLRDAKKKGQIPRSVDLVQWCTLLLATFVLPAVLENVLRTTGRSFTKLIALAAAGEVGPTLAETVNLAGRATFALSPLFLLVLCSSIVGMLLQGGAVLTLHPVKPKFERISPKAGLKRLFSVQSLVETGKAVTRLVVLAALVATAIVSAGQDHLTAAGLTAELSTEMLIDQLIFLLRLSALIGAAIGLLDYAFQRWQSMKKLRMTKHEVKQEHRNTEGDPATRGRRQSAHAKLSRNQMLKAVSGATVVVVNPSHYAVALTYDNDGGAPVVVAKGTEEVAWRIRERARLGDVPIVESPPLARALHAVVDVGDPIPESFFEAVAIVLAFVMRPRANTSHAVRRVAVPASKVPQETSA